MDYKLIPIKILLIVMENVLHCLILLLLIFYLAILLAARYSSFWEIRNPYLKDMASLNVVKAAMNSRDTAKTLWGYKKRT